MKYMAGEEGRRIQSKATDDMRQHIQDSRQYLHTHSNNMTTSERQHTTNTICNIVIMIMSNTNAPTLEGSECKQKLHPGGGAGPTVAAVCTICWCVCGVRMDLVLQLHVPKL